MIGISANVGPAHRMLDRIGDRLERPGDLLQVMATQLREYESEVFDTRGHGTWAGADLVESGRLMALLTGSPARDLGGDAVEAVETDYAGFLRSGARGTPKRDPAPVPAGHVQEEWAGEVLDKLLGGLL